MAIISLTLLYDYYATSFLLLIISYMSLSLTSSTRFHLNEFDLKCPQNRKPTLFTPEKVNVFPYSVEMNILQSIWSGIITKMRIKYDKLCMRVSNLRRRKSLPRETKNSRRMIKFRTWIVLVCTVSHFIILSFCHYHRFFTGKRKKEKEKTIGNLPLQNATPGYRFQYPDNVSGDECRSLYG